MFRGFKTQFDTSVPCLTNVLGVKGVGELGTIGATPTVVNAVVDALAHAGLGRDAERVQMPLTAQTRVAGAAARLRSVAVRLKRSRLSLARTRPAQIAGCER